MNRKSVSATRFMTGASFMVCGALVGCVTPDQPVPRAAQASAVAVDPVRTQPASADIIHLTGGIQCRLDSREVLVPGFIAIDSGWIEQVACLRGTREHESILVVDCQPSLVHSALLLIGLESGVPGRWRESRREDTYVIERIPPTGAPVRLRVRFKDKDGVEKESSVEDLITRAPDGGSFPETPWMFCGSRFDSKERYVADYSGSFVGFVTFGDEVLGLPGVISDQVSVDAAVWEVRTDMVPVPGTPVTLVLTPWDG